MTTYTYQLACGHAIQYLRQVKLTPDGKRWCKACREYKKVTSVVTEKFKQRRITTFF